MNKKSPEARAKILQLLVEGNSLRSTARIADVSINTVYKLLVDAGSACARYQDEALRNLPCKRIEVDEIWSFCYARRKNLPPELKDKPGYGDVWTWTSLCPDTRIVPCWLVADRTKEANFVFLQDLMSRMKGRIQLTSDGFKGYLEGVEQVFGDDIDYAMLVKTYGEDCPKDEGAKRKTKGLNGIFKQKVTGNPDINKVSTSLVERQNLTMRTNIKRYCRKTNAHSKKIENHAHAVALHFMYYNFVRIHSTLRVTPAMAAGVTNKLWSIEDIVDIIDTF